MDAKQQSVRLHAANRLLASLPSHEYTRLHRHLELVRLSKGTTLFVAGDTVRYAYFLNNGMASLLASTSGGTDVQVAMIGGEGIVGIPAFLRSNTMPYRVTVQLPAHALRIKAALLDAEFRHGGALTDALLRYVHMLITQITQSAVCNRYHTINNRLCRWLLISRDHTRSDLLPLTQETLSHMLGVQRTGVTAAAIALQQAKVIAYRRGVIRILDHVQLSKLSCECYSITKAELSQFLAA